MVFKINGIEEHLWIEYEKKIKDIENLSVMESQMEGLMSRSQEIKKQIQDLGPINNLAIEEYRNLKKRFEYYIKQKKDIEKAREESYSAIDEMLRLKRDGRTRGVIVSGCLAERQKAVAEAVIRELEGLVERGFADAIKTEGTTAQEDWKLV